MWMWMSDVRSWFLFCYVLGLPENLLISHLLPSPKLMPLSSLCCWCLHQFASFLRVPSNSFALSSWSRMICSCFLPKILCFLLIFLKVHFLWSWSIPDPSFTTFFQIRILIALFVHCRKICYVGCFMQIQNCAVHLLNSGYLVKKVWFCPYFVHWSLRVLDWMYIGLQHNSITFFPRGLFPL